MKEVLEESLNRFIVTAKDKRTAEFATRAGALFHAQSLIINGHENVKVLDRASEEYLEQDELLTAEVDDGHQI